MWHYGLLEGMSGEVPDGCTIMEVATYVCPFEKEYVGCVMLVSATDGNPAPYTIILNAIHGHTTDYQDHAMTDNLFVALMEFENAKCSLEIIVNTLAMGAVMRVSQWN